MSKNNRAIVFVTLLLIVLLALTGCQNSKNKKEYLERYAELMSRKTTMEDDEFRGLARDYFDSATEIRTWFEDKDFNEQFCKITKESFRNNKDSNNCLMVLSQLDSMGIENYDLKNAFEKEVQVYTAGDLDKAFELREEILSFVQAQEEGLGFYGEIDYGVSKETWDKYDTSELTVSDIIDLNYDITKISSSLTEKPITQHNVDVTKEDMSFSDKLDLIDSLEQYDYTDLVVISDKDIVDFISKNSKKIYMEKNKGGYYDNKEIEREYHYNKTQSMKDTITRDGITGFANTVDVSYMGDFASHTYDIEYVDENDAYKIKHKKFWEAYFRDCELDVDPSTFQTYNDFFYAEEKNSEGETVGYLFASTGREIDVYELDDVLSSDLVLKVVDAEETLKSISKEIEKKNKKKKLKKKYKQAVEALESEDYDTAEKLFSELGKYKDSEHRLQDFLDNKHQGAVSLMEDGNYQEAITEFEKISKYYDDTVLIEECTIKMLDEALLETPVDLSTLSSVSDDFYKNNEEYAYIYGKELINNSKWKEAKKYFEMCEDYEDAKKYIMYAQARSYGSDLDKAMPWYNSISGFLDSDEVVSELCYKKVINAESMSIEDAVAILNMAPLLNGEEKVLLDTCNELKKCIGKYDCYQKLKKDGTMTTNDIRYSVTFDFYLQKGEPFVSVNNSLFHDTKLYDAPVQKGEDEYQFMAKCTTSENPDNGTEVHWFSETEAKYSGRVLSNVYYYSRPSSSPPSEEASAENAMTSEEIKDVQIITAVQSALNAAGYDCGTPDGKPGPKTISALNTFQNEKGLEKTNVITEADAQALGVLLNTNNDNSDEKTIDYEVPTDIISEVTIGDATIYLKKDWYYENYELNDKTSQYIVYYEKDNVENYINIFYLKDNVTFPDGSEFKESFQQAYDQYKRLFDSFKDTPFGGEVISEESLSRDDTPAYHRTTHNEEVKYTFDGYALMANKSDCILVLGSHSDSAEADYAEDFLTFVRNIQTKSQAEDFIKE